MKILVVGPGTIGCVYGAFAAKSSASSPAPEVVFFIKPSHRERLSSGITLYPQNGFRKKPFHFSNFALIDSIADLKAGALKKKFDVILLAVPSDKLCAPGWFASLLEAAGEVQIWNLSPNLHDRDFIKMQAKQAFGKDSEDQLVWGRIPMLCYHSPLPGETPRAPGYGFFIPPGEKAKWSSKNTALAREVATFFNDRGLPAEAVEEIGKEGHLQDCLLRAVVAGIERNDWSFSKLVQSPDFPLVVEAMREMTAVQAAWCGTPDQSKTLLGKFFATRMGIRMFWNAMNVLAPFPFPEFFRIHFLKLDEQMRMGIDEFIEEGKKRGLPVQAIIHFRKNTPSVRPGAPKSASQRDAHSSQ